ncbi:hypothetical protein K438DRAFT_1759064 [Mycena galopus ATCC 62051]|nr:hypothetical protein K438DRAFT_1759064 [Mycena galopus ATCC 62051]
MFGDCEQETPFLNRGSSGRKIYPSAFTLLIIVMPLLRKHDSPKSDTIGEAVSFFKQIFETANDQEPRNSDSVTSVCACSGGDQAENDGNLTAAGSFIVLTTANEPRNSDSVTSVCALNARQDLVKTIIFLTASCLDNKYLQALSRLGIASASHDILGIAWIFGSAVHSSSKSYDSGLEFNCRRQGVQCSQRHDDSSGRYAPARGPRHDTILLPLHSFLIEHTISGRRFMFDIGMRNDPLNLAPSVASFFQSGVYSVGPFKDITELLEEGGIPLQSIETVIWSHSHFDHIGTWRNGQIALIEFPDSTLQASDFAGRDVVELDFDNTNLTFSGLPALIIWRRKFLSVEHTWVRHMTALARVTPSTFIVLGADTCHHAGQLRPRPKFQAVYPARRTSSLNQGLGFDRLFLVP